MSKNFWGHIVICNTNIFSPKFNHTLCSQNFSMGCAGKTNRKINFKHGHRQKYLCSNFVAKRKSWFDEDFFLVYIIIAALLLGAICGSIIANCQSRISLDNLVHSIEKFFSGQLFSGDVSIKQIFLGEVFKNGVTIIFLWLMAFIPLGKIFVLLCLFAKGICYGFTSSIIFDVYNLKGFWYISKFLLPLNIVLIPIFVFVSICSILFAKNLNKDFTCLHFLQYVLVLMFFLLLMLVAISVSIFIKNFLFHT